jgi:hypothetical protein
LFSLQELKRRNNGYRWIFIGGFLFSVDGAAYPKNHAANNQVFESGYGLYPNVIWQIAYKYENIDELVYELLDCLSPSTSMQVAIGIKIDDMRETNPGLVRMTALVYRRKQVMDIPNITLTTPTNLSVIYDAEQLVEFGTNISDVERGNLTISFPLQDLFFGLVNISTSIQALIAVHAQVIFPLSELHDLIMDLI